MNITATLFVEMIVFAGFIGLTRRYIWPPLIENIIKRQEEIAQGVEDAKQGTSLLKEAEAKGKAIIDEAKASHRQIIQQAQEAADDILADAKAEAKSVQAEQVAQGKKEIEKDIRKAQDGLEEVVMQQVRQILEKVMIALPDQQQLEKMVTQAAGEVRDQDK